MIKDNRAEFLIETKNMAEIISNLQMEALHCKAIMVDRIIRRRLYKVKSKQDDNQIRWLRILDGDIECDGSQRCTITYKDKKRDMSGVDYALLKVDNFDDAVHLFNLLNFTCTSYQENKRSKFVCKLDRVKYIVRFDIWPKIEDVIFVSVNAMTSTDAESLGGFVETLGLSEYNICKNAKVDVDAIYIERFKCAASVIPKLTFDFDLEIPQIL